ncbi:hypothetical protein [Gluconobacter morbifer]|uniref:Phage protein n=1 Tax=Gluconobacter morbifer G707 TaxID=1088869 RepID=G6XL40_9PROT|nr:hypothetical protein [Gluconobacter morbifer]EHH67468.1 hypothetical protein GMO_24630 [Gluconobacter morbifer G707]
MTPFIKHYCDTILPSPTGASDEETHFIPPFGWSEIMHIASDVQHQGRVASKQWGDVEVLSCIIEGQPHILAHIRTIQGTPFEGGFAWHRETLKAELHAIKSSLEIAGAAVFFGVTALELFSEPLDASQPSSGMMTPKRTSKRTGAKVSP